MYGTDTVPPGPMQPKAAPDGANGHDAGGLRPPFARNRGRPIWPGGPWGDGNRPPPGRENTGPGPVPGGRQHPYGGGDADGGALGPAGSSGVDGTPHFDAPRFNAPVPRHGYAWWYIDALSDDGQHGLTIIAFLGSVFSPFYAWSRKYGAGDPMQFCAVNAVLYGRPKRWAMTERTAGAVDRGPRHLSIGPSALHWDGSSLTISLDEVTAPLPSRLRGTVRVHPVALTGQRYLLDDAGRHRWSPFAPMSRVEVDLTHPALRWSGPGYFDSNEGDAALEDDFVRWDWCRAPMSAPGGAAILYNAERRVGGHQSLALHVAANGAVERFAPPPPVSLPATPLWRVSRTTRADVAPRVVTTLEDTPFYSRSVIETRLLGQSVTAVHESLLLDRFRAPWVQALLPFRIPRRWR